MTMTAPIAVKKKNSKPKQAVKPSPVTPQAPQSPKTLADKAMLVSFSRGIWEGRHKDKSTSDDVKKDNKAELDAGAWWTRAIPPKALKDVWAAACQGRVIHYKYTLPWNNDGTRILAATMYFEYTGEMSKVREQFYKAAEEFLKKYPDLVAEAPQRLGDLYRPEHFPAVDELRRKFYFETFVKPIPMATDFRIDLGAEATQEIRESIQQQAEQTMKEAMRDLWTRLHESLEKIAERLSDEKGVFRDSLIGNVVELCDLLPRLNITGDAELESIRQEVVKKIANQQPDDLRKDKTTRANAAQSAKDILKKMKEFMGGPL